MAEGRPVALEIAMDAVVAPTRRRLGWVLSLLALILASVVVPTQDAAAVCHWAKGGPVSTEAAPTSQSEPPESLGIQLAPEILAALPVQPPGNQIECGGGGGPLLALGRSTFRTNLIRWTPRTTKAVTNHHAHHVFSVKFEAKFKARGVSIHHPRFGAWWLANSHLKNSASYNARWTEFFAKNPNASQAQILQRGRQLNANYGLRSWF